MSLSGFLNVLKPPGMTSHDVVSFVRRRLPRKTKVGHLGTLDPPAAGVLPLAVGRATKLIPLLPDLGDSMKGYVGIIQLGVQTSTDDLEGEVLSRTGIESLTELTFPEVEKALHPFLGESQQVPPQVSAIKKNGVRAYKRVLKGEEFELPPRTVHISRLQLLEFHPESGRLKVLMICGSGTYVRSLARDLGQALGTGGALAFLLRSHSGPFHSSSALSLEEIMTQGVEESLLSPIYPFSQLPMLEGVNVESRGQKVKADFPAGTLLRAERGLLRSSGEEPGTAVVEALF